jgi:hypothetical protein
VITKNFVHKKISSLEIDRCLFDELNERLFASSEMLLVEQHAIDLLPLKDMLGALLTALAAAFMVVGGGEFLLINPLSHFSGAIPYVFQYAEIYKRKSALGFSLLVCLALCVANILRIEFWYGKRFETVLLVQSVVMIGCMLLMLEISVRMNKKMIPPSQRTSVWSKLTFMD